MDERTTGTALAEKLGELEDELRGLRAQLNQSREREQRYRSRLDEAMVARERAEAELGETRARVALAQQAAEIGFFDWDVPASKSVWSPQLEAILGLKPGEGSFERWPQLVHPDDLARTREESEWCFREKCPEIHGDFRIVRPSGEVRWLEGRGNVFYDDAGAPLRMIGAFVDITERKRGEQALRESEARNRREAAELALIYATAPVGLCVLDTELRYVRVNERLADMNGVPPTKHLGRTVREILTKEVADASEPRLRNVLATGEPVLAIELSGEIAAQPGVRHHWMEQFWPLLDSDGNPFGINVVVEDVTERKRLEESRRLEQEFRALAENSTDIIVRFDRSLRRIYANPAIERLLGRGREAILGRTHRELGLPQEVADLGDDQVRQVFATGGQRVMEFWLPTPRGRRYLQSQMIPEFGSNGTVATVLVVTRDLTRSKQIEEALRESEERYRRMVETANEGIWVIDTRARTLLANRRMAEILGCTIEDVQRNSVLDFVFEEDRAAIRRHIDANLAGAAEQFDFRFRRLNGSAVHLLGCTSAVTNAEDRVVGVLGMFTDITRRKHAEEALRQSEARWKSLFDNAPFPIWEEDFSAIRARFDALRSAGVEDLEQHLETHPQETARLAGLVNILDMSRSTAKTFEVSSVAELSRSLPDYFDAESLAVFAKEMVALWRGETSFAAEIPIRHPSGGSRLLELHLSVVPGYEASLARVLVSFGDITDRRRAEEAIHQREQEFRALAERSPDVVTRVDRNLRSLYVNPAIEQATGFPPAYFSGKDLRTLDLPAEAKSRWVENTRAVFDTAEERSFEFSYRGPDGKELVFYTRAVPEFVAEGRVETVISVTRDITRLREAEAQIRANVELLEAANAQLALQSRQDSLTGLANRRYLFSYLEAEWRRETRHGRPLSLIMADIDHFKDYNDHYGHLAGDECLRDVANALQSQVHRPGDLLARYGGEEFVVVLPETTLHGARELAENLRHAVARLNREHRHSRVAPYVTISLGVAELSPKGHNMDELILLADAALYRAKTGGRNQVAVSD